MTPLATSLLHRFRAAFADLAELRDEEGRMRINEAIRDHMASTAPMFLPDALAEVTRALADESHYRLSVVEGCLVVKLVDNNDREALSTLTDLEAQRLRLDVDAVMRSRR